MIIDVEEDKNANNEYLKLLSNLLQLIKNCDPSVSAIVLICITVLIIVLISLTAHAISHAISSFFLMITEIVTKLIGHYDLKTLCDSSNGNDNNELTKEIKNKKIISIFDYLQVEPEQGSSCFKKRKRIPKAIQKAKNKLNGE